MSFSYATEPDKNKIKECQNWSSGNSKWKPTQVLKVSVNPINLWTGRQSFYAKMSRDGRILIPNLTLA